MTISNSSPKSQDPAYIHDPMCPGVFELEGLAHTEPGFVRNCQCALIAQVREDEQTRVVCQFLSDHGDREIYAAAIRDARNEAAIALMAINTYLPTDEHNSVLNAIESLGG